MEQEIVAQIKVVAGQWQRYKRLYPVLTSVKDGWMDHELQKLLMLAGIKQGEQDGTTNPEIARSELSPPSCG